MLTQQYLKADQLDIARGYSGKDWGKNNPKAQAVPGVGPIPQGKWHIGNMINSLNTGPMTITLAPAFDTETFSRSLFRIHGDSIKLPGTASHGCIILASSVRQEIIASGDFILEVIE